MKKMILLCFVWMDALFAQTPQHLHEEWSDVGLQENYIDKIYLFRPSGLDTSVRMVMIGGSDFGIIIFSGENDSGISDNLFYLQDLGERILANEMDFAGENTISSGAAYAMSSSVTSASAIEQSFIPTSIKVKNCFFAQMITGVKLDMEGSIEGIEGGGYILEDDLNASRFDYYEYTNGSLSEISSLEAYCRE
ncbi:MAG: hypothetical protein OXB84_06880 [Halobacteriovoraceae bacterium]|nr:hypothetical protein [Halobacteriovoraceae bacterium]